MVWLLSVAEGQALSSSQGYIELNTCPLFRCTGEMSLSMCP